MRTPDAGTIFALFLMWGCNGSLEGLGNEDPSAQVDASHVPDQVQDPASTPDAALGEPDVDAAHVPVEPAQDASPGDAVDAAVPPEPEPEPVCKRTVPVQDRAGLERALADVVPGDCIELADGDYTFPTITAQGSELEPIVVRAANLLGAVVESGNLELKAATHVMVEGLRFESSGNVRLSDCDHCRISRFRMQRSETDQEVDWVSVSGSSDSCRIDHSEFGPQTRVGNMVMLAGKGAEVVQRTRIDHNYFHDVAYAGGNGWEIIRAGLSGYTFSSGFTVIEHNLFVRAHSDPETISVKSSDNIIRHNTMRETAGQFTLRHGNRTSVYGNYILGDGVSGSSGLRIYGGEHTIYNNYIADVEGLAIHVDGGKSDDDSGELRDHKVSYGVQVLFNTIVSKRGIALGSGKPLKPSDCVVAYNLLQGSKNLLSEQAGTTNTRFLDNIVHGGEASVDDGVWKVDPKLEPFGDTFRITATSPAMNAGEPTFEFVSEDIMGRTRNEPDIGAHEVSSAKARYRMLSEDDVGPSSP